MTDFLSAEALMEHVRALAQDIGPRPTGHSEEEQARDYIRRVLHDAEITDIEEMPFPAWDTWGYLLIVPASLSLMGNILGKIGRFGELIGGTLTLAGAIDGANDNATGVACLLRLGAHLRQNPLSHTEIWLAFTGAEEVG